MDNIEDYLLKPCDSDSEIKPFLSIEELISKLKFHEDGKINPLKFSEEEFILAKEFFRYTNYYSFAIYKKQLIPHKNTLSNIEGEQYSFTDCLSIYDFDSYLREKLNYFAGIIEAFLKATFVNSSCIYYAGELNDAEFYLDRDVYIKEETYSTAMNILNGLVKDNKSLTIEHHKNKWNYKFPFWVLIEELTFGEATKVISCFKTEYIKFWIQNSFLDTKEERQKVYDDNVKSSMFGWFQSVQHIRNICAHYSRLYGTLIKVSNPSISAYDKRMIKGDKQGKDLQNNQLLVYLMAFSNILDYHATEIKDEWNNFIEELDSKIINGEHIYPNKLGFIDNWKKYVKIEIYE